jgi:phage recombination protein Bet
MPNDLIRQPEAQQDKYSDAAMIETLKKTVCEKATEAQFRMFIEVCRATNLNPFLREIWFVPSVGIMAGRDGYLAVANRNPQFDGMETRVERDDKKIPIKAICTVWRKDRSHPIICEAYYSEYKKSSNVWSQYPSAMISKVAEVLALKRSFGINGVVTEEEIGTGEPRGSAAAAQEVVEAKLSGKMPLVAAEEKETSEPASVVAEPDPLQSTLATFSTRAAITAAFVELKKAWLKYESEEAWLQTLEQFGLNLNKGGTVGLAKRCFTALWKAVERMQDESRKA